MNQQVMLVAGEASGDMHAAGLIRELKQHQDVDVFGVGGDSLREQGMELIYHIRQMSVLGFGDVIRQFAFFRKVYRHLVAMLDERKPDLIILVDYPGLNLKLAKAARKRNIPVYFYIAPQVWAWGAGRIPKMAKLIDRMGVIIPFEEKLFRDAGLETEYVGHPLMEHLTVSLTREELIQKFQLQPDKKIVGLLPGSRMTEVNRLLPDMLNTVSGMENIEILISKAHTVDERIYREILGHQFEFHLVAGLTPEIMEHSDALIVSSGTATLESALHETPLIIVYRVDPLSYWLGKRLVKIKNIGLANVIAGKQIVPEFIQDEFQADQVRPVLQELLYNEETRSSVIQDLLQLKVALGTKAASKNAAIIALSMLCNGSDV